MRIAAIYDIHGNLPALETVLDEIRRENVDQIVVGGDVLPGPMPRETIRTLLKLDTPTKFIRGNGDRAVLARLRGEETSGLPEQARKAIRWAAEQLTPADERMLADWPETLRISLDTFGEVLFCHATPEMTRKYSREVQRKNISCPPFPAWMLRW